MEFPTISNEVPGTSLKLFLRKFFFLLQFNTSSSFCVSRKEMKGTKATKEMKKRKKQTEETQ